MKSLIVFFTLLGSISFYAEAKSSKSSASSSNLNSLGKAIDFRNLREEEQKIICSSVCGEEYAFDVQFRNFYQISTYSNSSSQSGLLCLKRIQWSDKGTPCHLRPALIGISLNGLAPTLTEIHTGLKSGEEGAYCVAYNPDDFPGMKKAISERRFKLGEVACLSGMKLNSIGKPIDLKSLRQEEHKKICGNVCGEEYAFSAEVKDFKQLKIYPNSVNKSGILCSTKLPIKWSDKGTSCHKRNPHNGTPEKGLARNKTEIHKDENYKNQDGAWCHAYNEDDFKGMKESIKFGFFKPGQVVCRSGVKLNSVR